MGWHESRSNYLQLIISYLQRYLQLGVFGGAVSPPKVFNLLAVLYTETAYFNSTRGATVVGAEEARNVVNLQL